MDRRIINASQLGTLTRHATVQDARIQICTASAGKMPTPRRKRKTRAPTTQLSLKWLRKNGYTCHVVERWNAFAHKRIDMFGIIDIVAIDCNVLGVQTTTLGHLPEHIEAAKANKNTLKWLHAGGVFELHGWRQLCVGKRSLWRLRRHLLTLIRGYGEEHIAETVIDEKDN